LRNKKAAVYLPLSFMSLGVAAHFSDSLFNVDQRLLRRLFSVQSAFKFFRDQACINIPFGVILASVFFAALSTGGQSMQLVSGVPAHLTDVISGIIIFLVATKNIVQIVQKRWRKNQTISPVKEA